MKRLILIICLVLSVVAYFEAPIGFSERFTVSLSIIFGISSLVMLRNNCKHTIIKFEFFFVLAFFFTNVIYTLVYYQVNPYFGLFNLPFNEDYISRGFALSVLGICAFNLGVFENKSYFIKKQNTCNEHFGSPKVATILLMLLFLPYMFTLIQRHMYTTEFESNLVNVVLVYLVYFSLFYIIYYNRQANNIGRLIKNNVNNTLVYFIIVYFLVFIIIGSRTIPLRIILFSLFIYSVYIQPIKTYKVAFIILIGAVFMAFLGVSRSGGTFSLDAASSIFDIGKELTINNRSLYVLMEYADEKGVTYGESMLMGVLSIIPFAQKIYLLLTGNPLSSISSGVLVTDLYYETSNDDRVGLGTNIIGDIYLAYGMLGVLFLMFIFGKFVSYIYRKASKGINLYIFLYGSIFMDAIYYPRSTILTSARAFVWLFIIFQIYRNKKVKTGLEKLNSDPPIIQGTTLTVKNNQV